MNKAELIDAVAKDGKISKKDAAAAVDAVINTVTSALKKGDKVTISVPAGDMHYKVVSIS